MNRLYLFPVKYPFTDNVECFLNDEIPFLSREFDQIILVPLKKEVEVAKKLPENCRVVAPVLRRNLSFIFRGLFCKRTFFLLFRDFFSNAVWTDLKKFKIWLVAYITVNNILNSPQIKKIENELSLDDVCYFYWGKWSNVLSYFWQNKTNCISRFHGWGDLWEYDYNDYFPLRKEVIKSLKYAVHISSVGKKYFDEKYPNSKNIIFRLGSFDNFKKIKNDLDIINIVSCSSLWPLKRVDLIMDAVCEFSKTTDKYVCWTHIGGSKEEVINMKKLAEKKKQDNLEINFIGSIPHEKVLEFYQTHECDIFLNLSTSEGVPVSIMEAISFDIPAIATNVGGTLDVVKSGVSGELLEKDPSVKDVVAAIHKVLSSIEIYTPRKYWDQYFNAQKNYSAFAKFLKDQTF